MNSNANLTNSWNFTNRKAKAHFSIFVFVFNLHKFCLHRSILTKSRFWWCRALLRNRELPLVMDLRLLTLVQLFQHSTISHQFNAVAYKQKLHKMKTNERNKLIKRSKFGWGLRPLDTHPPMGYSFLAGRGLCAPDPSTIYSFSSGGYCLSKQPHSLVPGSVVGSIWSMQPFSWLQFSSDLFAQLRGWPPNDFRKTPERSRAITISSNNY